MTASDPSLGDLRIEDFVAEFLPTRNRGAITYEPREDSFLMLEALAESSLHGLRVLDMGTGSGILATYCARRGADVTASDIDIEAIRALQLTSDRMGISIKLVTCDLFSEIPERFDIVVFNPPYLPSSTIGDRTTDGGKHGTEVISRFLDELTQHLVGNGRGMLVVSSLNDPEGLMMRHPGLSFRTVRERSLFFERLFVLEAKVRQASSLR
ncbi:MAG: HemK2/MTQ2 family protein methyltransferase [Candidatus Bathyarchaeia archaeon]|jgi:release factor glutamine methyltransferase